MLRNGRFCGKMMDFSSKMIGFTFKMVDFSLNRAICRPKLANFSFNVDNFRFKMASFSVKMANVSPKIAILIFEMVILSFQQVPGQDLAENGPLPFCPERYGSDFGNKQPAGGRRRTGKGSSTKEGETRGRRTTKMTWELGRVG